MKKMIAIIFIIGLVLSACSSTPPTRTEIPGAVYTVVAQTLTAMYTPMTSTPTPKPATSTPLPKQTSTPTTATTPTPVTPTVPGIPCLSAKFVNDVTIPDNKIMSPGEIFTKTWAINNNGSCNWSEDFQLKFYDGTKMDGHMTKVEGKILAGDTTTFSIRMVAPLTPGTYTGYWSLIDDKMMYFGEMVTVKIIVQK